MSDRIPRLEMEDLAPDLAAALAPRVERLGYLGEFFKCVGHQPRPLISFIEFTESAKGGLAPDIVETIALTLATYMGNSYERHQHERLSVRLGLGPDWVTEVEKLSPETANISAEAKVVQCYCLKAMESKGQSVATEFGAVLDALGHEQAIAVMMLMGRYVVHALIVNTLDLAPPVPSIFDDGFGG